MAKKIKLVIFPGEGTTWVTRIDDDRNPRSKLITIGSIYVVNGQDETFDMVGGPPPGHGYKDVGGHTAEPTPPGHYLLDREEQVVTSSWPTSVIPWEAKLREQGVEIQYQIGGQWLTATGRHGTVTQALQQFWLRGGRRRSFDAADGRVRTWFYRANGELWPTWRQNEFGPKSWNLKKHGDRTAFFIHTTPTNENQDFINVSVVLDASHGCIHIRPADREEMVNKHYLEAGMQVEIRKYGEVGPPK